MKKEYWKKILGIIWLIFFISGFFLSAIWIEKNGGIIESAKIFKNISNQNYCYSIIIFLTIFLIRPFIFLPSSILLLAAGFIFGKFFGAILAGVGEIFSAIISFFIARKLGRNFISNHENNFFRRLDYAASKRGFFTIFVLRQIMFIPFDLVNFAAGLSGISFRDYFLATSVGVFPPIFAITFLGDSFSDPKNIFFSIGILLVLIFVGIWAKKHPHFIDFFKDLKNEKFSKIREKTKKYGKKISKKFRKKTKN